MESTTALPGLADPPAVPAPQPGAAPRPPWIVWLGLAVVLAAAAVLSFEALQSLALAVGIGERVAWLLPVAIDAGAAVSCAVWLGGRSPEDAARYAGRMTWSLLGTTVAGNAAQLGMAAAAIVPPWWVATIVGAIPPAVVGSTVHLVVLLVRRSDRLESGATTETADDIDNTETVDAPERDELLDAVIRWASDRPGPISGRAIRAEFSVGPERAKRLLEQMEAAA